jgi:hypothetical protein
MLAAIILRFAAEFICYQSQNGQTAKSPANVSMEWGRTSASAECRHGPPVTALSLGGLRRRIEIALLPDNVDVMLQLDGLAERERHRRRAQAQPAR